MILELRKRFSELETGFEGDLEVQITFSGITEFVSRRYAGFSAHTKIRGDFGGVIYVFRNSGICKTGKKKPPIFFGGVFCLTSELAQVLADVVDDLERRPFRRIDLIICAVVKLFAFVEEAFNRLKALIAAAV